MQLIGLRISNLLISKAQSYSTCIGWALKMGIRKLFHGVGVCAFFFLKEMPIASSAKESPPICLQFSTRSPHCT